MDPPTLGLQATNDGREMIQVIQFPRILFLFPTLL